MTNTKDKLILKGFKLIGQGFKGMFLTTINLVLFVIDLKEIKVIMEFVN